MLPDELIRGYDATRPLAAKAFRAGCYAPFVSLYFRPMGEVQACCKNELFLLGNVAKSSLEEIWRGARANQLRKALRQYAFGAGCEHCEWQIRNGNFAGAYTRIFDDLPVESEVPEWPAMMEFAVSNTCNLECTMCTGELSSSIRARRDRLPPLPKVYGDRFFDELRRFLPHLKRVKFFGGEPFLAEECFRIFDLMEEAGLSIPCHVTTNGTIWNDRVERVLERFPTSISVSIDGATAETFERIRVNASFATVMRNLDRFAEYARRRGTTLSISHCLMQQNWPEFFDVLRLAQRHLCPVWINTVVEPPSHSLYALAPERQLEIADRLEATGRGRLDAIERNRDVWDNEIANLRRNARGEGETRIDGVLQDRESARQSADPVAPAWPLVREGRLNEALERLEAIDPRSFHAWRAGVLRSQVLRLLGRLDEAQAQARECVRVAPRRSEPKAELAWILVASGRFDEALEEAAKAVELARPRSAEEVAARQALAAALLRSGRSDEALAQLEPLIGLEPDLPGLGLDRGWTCLALGRVDDAEVAAEAVLARAPDDRDAARLRQEVVAMRARMKGGVDPVARGWELADAARHAEAVVVLDGAEEVIRGSRAWRLARAHSLRLLGRVDEAEAELQAALEAARQLPEAYTELAWIRQAQRRLDEGLELARRAIQLASGHPTEIGALHAAGALAFELGLLDEAQRHADRLVKLRPKRTEFRMGRGWISLARNDPAEALAEARQVLARNPGDPGALDLESRARANLESLESTPSRATERH